MKYQNPCPKNIIKIIHKYFLSKLNEELLVEDKYIPRSANNTPNNILNEKTRHDSRRVDRQLRGRARKSTKSKHN